MSMSDRIDKFVEQWKQDPPTSIGDALAKWEMINKPPFAGHSSQPSSTRPGTPPDNAPADKALTLMEALIKRISDLRHSAGATGKEK
ncbi:hypothetical protein [Lacipirellula parvula]|uniref:Uncharacterized protein n=1 Tax=Lacipirellula parvula TaxID=2650471 RepID=A0A5K7XD73_9BACT|nr:hypothetical protein [Lacipirellula parvula]BBO34335.1 hypothetical protein PLANPX_3947 [Lacipirellula parvula]